MPTLPKVLNVSGVSVRPAADCAGAEAVDAVTPSGAVLRPACACGCASTGPLLLVWAELVGGPLFSKEMCAEVAAAEAAEVLAFEAVAMWPVESLDLLLDPTEMPGIMLPARFAFAEPTDLDAAEPVVSGATEELVTLRPVVSGATEELVTLRPVVSGATEERERG